MDSCTNTNPQRDSIFTKGPSDVLNGVQWGGPMGSRLNNGGVQWGPNGVASK